ncbi:MAG TPA: glycosyltransferase, partial [Acetobacteraceae bacterium]|nr:glycosyltransferase [Acetobacteraceae bacterium]
GAFSERLAGRPLTWLMQPTLDPAVWLGLFDTVAATLQKTRKPVRDMPMRHVVAGPPPPVRSRAHRRGPVDLRRSGTTSALVIPEAYDDEANWTPCAHIRLLRPLHHPVTGHGLATSITDADGASRYHADVVITQRHAVSSIAAAEALVDHARRTDAALVFDIDDDLLTIPPEHPEAAELTSKAAVVEYLVRRADIVRTSTAALAARIAPLARRVQVAPNALDERIWLPELRERANRYDGVRILCMGTMTHDADFALLLPALTEIHSRFGDQIQFDLIGFVTDTTVPTWIRRLAPTPHAGRSYAGFVHWLRSSGPWDIGLAPLAETPFNACKSAIKVLDYAALGLASVASDVAAYRGSLADGPGGILLPNTTDAWYEALSRLIRDAAWRHQLAAGGAAQLLASRTLERQADAWPDVMRRKLG